MTTIKGSTKVDGTATGGVQVRLHRADTGAPLTTVTSKTAHQDAVTGGFAQIATEGNNFTVSAGSVVRFGASGGHFSKTYSSAGTYPCTSSEFGGDPASGQSKTCELVLDIPALEIGDYFIPNAGFVGDAYLVATNPTSTLNDLIVRVNLP